MMQPTQLYWPQHKVFFVATLALFPSNLNGHEVNALFYRPYFPSDDPDFVEIWLQEYRKDGYLKYEKSGALYKIVDVDTKKANKDLTQYLEQWQHNGLHALSSNKPPDAARQNELLLSAITLDYPDHKDVQRITLEDVYGKPGNYAYIPPFWELILAYQLLYKKIEITSMGYGRQDDGLYDDDSQPAVDINIVDAGLASLVERQVATPTTSPSIVAIAPDSTLATYEGHVIKDGRQILIAISGHKNYIVAQLEKGGSYDRFMDYVIDEENTNINIGIEDIKALKGTLQSVKSLSELIRYSGFVKPYKKSFFTTTKKDSLRFVSTALLDDKQIDAIRKQAEKVKAKKS